MRVRGRRRGWIVAGALGLFCAAAWGIVGGADVVTRVVAIDIDAYPLRTKVSQCADPLVGRPGVVAFRAMILSQVGGGDDGLAVCKKIANGSGAYSDHADGRAWDWHVDASSAADRATVDRTLNWLLRTDDRGHRNAMARRIGMTYIIWNHRYYRVGGDDARWVPYTGTGDPHDTHVHFSFSVAGAMGQTSWWRDRGPLVWSLLTGPSQSFAFGSGLAFPVAGDWDGDGRDSVGIYDPATRRFQLSDGPSSAGPTLPIGPFGAIPIVGNWDGVAGDELGVYEPWACRFSFYSAAATPVLPSLTFGNAGDLPIVGDWDADGTDDVGSYSAQRGTFSLSLPDGAPRTVVFGGVNDTPVVGDWDGDGVDDVGVFRSSDHVFLLAPRSSDGVPAVRSVGVGTRWHRPVTGDWDGDGTDDPGVATTR